MDNNLKLTSTVKCAGCAAKLSSELLHSVVSKLPKIENKNLIVGTDSLDDAGVYRLTDDIAIVQTVDFFPPIVNDPFSFGQIAAANAISDIYAMGGSPLTALNIIGFPQAQFDISVLEEILRGGLTKMQEAGIILVGGHSIDDAELKYGLAVTGTIHPENVITNATLQHGDILVLTKPLGTGIMTTGIKGESVKREDEEEVIKVMSELNKTSSETMRAVGVSACTDVTGFGLAGHLYEMLSAGKCRAEIYLEKLPVFSKALELAEEGIVPAGIHGNRKHFSRYVQYEPENIPEEKTDIIFDPQTSGGLLISVSPDKKSRLISELHKNGVKDARCIGKVYSTEGEPEITVKDAEY